MVWSKSSPSGSLKQLQDTSSSPWAVLSSSSACCQVEDRSGVIIYSPRSLLTVAVACCCYLEFFCQGIWCSRESSDENTSNNDQPFFSSFFFFFSLDIYNCIIPMGFLPWEIRVVFSGESQLRQNRATQPTAHAGCCSVSIIYRTPTWTTGYLKIKDLPMFCMRLRTGVCGHRKRVCTES